MKKRAGKRHVAKARSSLTDRRRAKRAERILDSTTGDRDRSRPDIRTDVLLDALRHAARFLKVLKKEPVKVEIKLPQQIAVLSLLRAARLLEAIVTLLDNGHVFGAEPVIRALFDIAFNVAWIGTDDGRALRFQDNGLRRAEAYFRTMREEYNFELNKETTEWLRALFGEQSEEKQPKLPTIEQRAREVTIRGSRFNISGMPRSYLAYRRLSAGIHGDFWHIRVFWNTPDAAALWLDAADAVAAALFVILVGTETLGQSARAEKIVSELRNAFSLSKGNGPTEPATSPPMSQRSGERVT